MTFGDYAAVTFLIVVISTIMIAGWAAFTAPYDQTHSEER